MVCIFKGLVVVVGSKVGLFVDLDLEVVVDFDIR